MTMSDETGQLPVIETWERVQENSLGSSVIKRLNVKQALL
jgi:hypothetical protein